MSLQYWSVYNVQNYINFNEYTKKQWNNLYIQSAWIKHRKQQFKMY